MTDGNDDDTTAAAASSTGGSTTGGTDKLTMTMRDRPVAFVFCKVLPYTILFLAALFTGWCSEHNTPMWEGKFFAALYPVMNGHLPPIMVGSGKMEGTPEVPQNMLPQPRPANELFLPLRGNDGDGGGDIDSDDSAPNNNNNNNNMNMMPQSGIGMCCRPSAYDDVLVERTVLWYLLLGGRHIDTAALYLNHKPIGRAIQEAIRRGIPRSEIWITTKLWPSQFGHKTAHAAVTKQWLKELQVDYIDMVLLHMPKRVPRIPIIMADLSDECLRAKVSAEECHRLTWLALSELRSKGTIRNLGVSNFAVGPDDTNKAGPPSGNLDDDSTTSRGFLEALVSLHDEVDSDLYAPVTNNQIPFNPWLPMEWKRTVSYCQEHKIQITGYYNLGSHLQHGEARTLQVLKTLADKHSKGSVAQIMLRWALQKGTAIIPGTGNPDHMKENLGVYDAFVLSDAEMEEIDSLSTAEEAKRFWTVTPSFFAY